MKQLTFLPSAKLKYGGLSNSVDTCRLPRVKSTEQNSLNLVNGRISGENNTPTPKQSNNNSPIQSNKEKCKKKKKTKKAKIEQGKSIARVIE